MWIIIKLVVVGLSFLARFRLKYFWGRSLGDKEIINSAEIFIQKIKNKNSVVATEFRFHFETPVLFKISKETSLDRFFKKMGISTEIQTGDTSFDSSIYLASDSFTFQSKIMNDETLRKVITLLFQAGCKYIQCDGRVLKIVFPSDRASESLLKSQSVQVKKLFNQFTKIPVNQFQDHFAIKALIVEGIIWSIFTYSCLSFFNWIFVQEDVHINKIKIAYLGVALGLIVTVIICAGVFYTFRGSSRGHRIFIESFILLLLGLPVGGIGLFCDLNTQLDRSLAKIIEADIVSVEERVSRSRRGRKNISYHLALSTKQNIDNLLIPRNLKISRETYHAIKAHDSVNIELGEGYLKQVWIRSIKPNKLTSF